MAPYGYELSRAEARVTLTSYLDPGSSMHEAILNPGSLPFDIGVEIGELNPVGASHSTLQYGHTKSVSSQMELYFSAQLQGRLTGGARDDRTSTLGGLVPIDVREHVNWLASFCYGPQPHLAPSPLIILWPHVCNMTVVVASFRAEYIRFQRNLFPTAAKVTLQYKELRVSWKSASAQRKDGWLAQDSALKDAARTGPAVRYKGK